MPTVRGDGTQFSFAAGEVSPRIFGRVDMTKYQQGLETCRNFYVGKHGGVFNRAGTGYVCENYDSTRECRLVPWIFNADQTYVLVFEHLRLRFIRNDALVLNAAQAITGLSTATDTITIVAHGYTTDQEVWITGVGGTTQLNDRQFKVVTTASPDVFKLKYMDGTAVDMASFGVWTSGGTVASVYTVTTSYTEAELPDIQFAQSADVMRIVHPSHAPAKLSRTGHTSWTLVDISFEPAIGRPASCEFASTFAGALIRRYRITAIRKDTYEESLPGYEIARTIIAATNASPCAITTSAAHLYSTGDEVYITGVTGMTELNGRTYRVTVTGGATLTLDGVDSTSYGAYIADGTIARTYMRLDSQAALSAAAPAVLNWRAVENAKEYNIYRYVDGVYGFIGTVGATVQSSAGVTLESYSDDGSVTASKTEQPPATRTDTFTTATNYPSAVALFQNRAFYANTGTAPQGVWGTRTGSFNSLTVSTPLQDDDSIRFEMIGRQVNAVKFLLDLGNLLVFTTGGEWALLGDANGGITPFDINPKQYTANGSSTLAPLVVSGTALYVQARGGLVRDLGFDFQTDGYKGNDLTLFASHLFENYTLRDWAYQQVPDSIVWAIRSDGTALGLTYLREQMIWAWHRHDFENGTARQVTCIPVGQEDAVYFSIKRTINGVTKRYVERMLTRASADIREASFMDSSLLYDGRNTGAQTMTLSGGTTWAYDETITCTSSVGGYFTAADVGNAIFFYDTDGAYVFRLTIEGYTSGTVVTGKPSMTVPVAYRSVAKTAWAKAVDELTNLWHLAGEDVSVFGDGTVVGSPHNASVTMTYTVPTSVASSTITLDDPYAVIRVGLPITADVKTLAIDTVGGETMVDKQKLITKVTLLVEKSRGIWAGAEPPSDDEIDPLEGLDEAALRDTEGYDEPVDLTTGPVEITVGGHWNKGGQVFVRQVDPVPLGILLIAPHGLIPAR